ncbi:hypothetical protein ACFRA1_13310 [Bacillus subtilis]
MKNIKIFSPFANPFFMQRAVFCTKRITHPKIPEVFSFFSIYKVVSLMKGAFLINLRFKCL